MVETDRLLLRPVTEEDAPAMAEFFNADDYAFSARYAQAAYSTETPFDTARIRNAVLPTLEATRDHLYEMYAFRKEDEKIIGMIEFSRDYLERNRVSYFISPSLRRLGYASEAYAACVNAAVSAGALSGELYAHTAPANTASQAFLKAAGFTCHGRKEIVRQLDGNTYSHAAIAFTRPLSMTDPVKMKR